jgi:hypothetical protein
MQRSEGRHGRGARRGHAGPPGDTPLHRKPPRLENTAHPTVTGEGRREKKFYNSASPCRPRIPTPGLRPLVSHTYQHPENFLKLGWRRGRERYLVVK